MTSWNSFSIGAVAPGFGVETASGMQKLMRWAPLFRVCFGCAVFFAASVRAGEYRLESFALVSGGGAIEGGNYEVTGSTGQADAGGELIGGDYKLEGGFWPTTVEVTVAGGPTLEISLVQGSVRMAWVPAATGYTLQVASSADPADWVDVPGVTTNPTIFPVSEAPRFFRLIRR